MRDLGEKARLVYVTPSHQFPTGVAMSLTRRLELIEWSRRHNSVLIEDDYDSEYRYSGPPLPALQGLATGVAVIYIGTFSKVMFPSLRIGYIIAPGESRRPAAARQVAGRPAHPSSRSGRPGRLHRRRAFGAPHPPHAPDLRSAPRCIGGIARSLLWRPGPGSR